MAGRLESKLQSSPAITCMKTMLMVFNFVFWVTGVAILTLGVWMLVQLHIYFELTTVYYTEAPYVLIGVGGGIVIVGILACCCTAKGVSFLLYLLSAFLMVVFVAELGVGIAGFVYRGKIEEGFGEGLTIAMNEYGTNDDKKNAWDGIQENLKCCGKNSYDEWFSVEWDGASTTANSVPKSCCKVDADACINTGLAANSTDIYPDGCYSLVTSFMSNNFGIIGGVAIGFAFFQLFGALLSCALAKNINKAKYEQVA